MGCCDCYDSWCDKEVRSVGEACGCKCSETCCAIGVPEVREPVSPTVDRNAQATTRHQDDPRGRLVPLPDTPMVPPMERTSNSGGIRTDVESLDRDPSPPPYEGVTESLIGHGNSGQPVVVPSILIQLDDPPATLPLYEDVMVDNTSSV
ncbi:uncharacterized protein LOC102807629 [Saccoglossus kowalevskii]